MSLVFHVIPPIWGKMFLFIFFIMGGLMRISRLLCVLLAATFLLGSGSDAFAKLGKGKSMGSRSSRTYDRPMERTVTPPPPASVAPAPVPLAAPQTSGFFQSHPFMSGFMGGMVGMGIGSMLFDHPAYASFDAAPGAGILGLLLQLALVGGLVWWVIRLFRGQTAGVVRAVPVSTLAASGVRPLARTAKEFEPSDGDKQMFAQILMEAQRAWSHADIGALKQIATPEMVSYLADDLAADSSQGVQNIIEDVQLLNGDIIESWSEGGRQFVTAVLTFAAKDYTLRLDNRAVIEGNPVAPTQNVEAWTFVRVGSGRWLLSAVERQHS